MRLFMFVFMLIVIVPSLLSAQALDCPDCVLGIYDDPELSQNFGFWDTAASLAKSVWVGIVYDSPSQFEGLTGIELSVDGIGAFCGSQIPCLITGIPEPTVVVGPSIPAPADTINGDGGVNMVWADCLPDNRALVQINLLSLSPVPNDVVIRVRRKFPPSDSDFPAPLFTQCDDPLFTKTSVTAGCYVINPTVGPGETVGDCTLTEPISVEPSAWSTIKRLYRDATR